MRKLSADQQLEVEMRRQQLIEKAVMAADMIITDGGDGVEEINFLTSELALRFAEKAARVHRHAILRKDLGLGEEKKS